MSKEFIIVIIFLICMLSAGVAGWFARGERVQTQIVKVQVKQNKAVEQVAKQKAKREIVYVDREKVIHDAKDNCLDQPLSPDILHVLSTNPTTSRIDEGLRISHATGENLPRGH